MKHCFPALLQCISNSSIIYVTVYTYCMLIRVCYNFRLNLQIWSVHFMNTNLIGKLLQEASS